MLYRRLTFVPLLRLAACGLAAAAVWLVSQQETVTSTDRSPAGIVAGRRAYLDPVTGRITAEPPTGVQALELGPRELEMLSRSTDGLAVRRSIGGAVTVDLGGRFRHLSVATIDTHGTLRSHCTDTVTESHATAEAPR